MNASTLGRSAVLLAGLCAAPLAFGQEAATPMPHWGFIATMAALGMAFVLGILTLILFTENRRTRDKLALVERLVTGGQPVPRDLMVNEPRQLTLPEEQRRDVRRGIAFLCWGIGIGVVFYIVSGENPRAAAWGLLFIVPGLGNFLKAWLTARDIARGAAAGSH
jgi:hypothetical protein